MAVLLSRNIALQCCIADVKGPDPHRPLLCPALPAEQHSKQLPGL